MSEYYLAIDIGASSGRHILGHMENGSMQLEEIYRFENGMTKKNGSLLWDTKHLFSEIIAGMKRCREIGKIPVTLSVDTWAVDYVLLDENDRILGESYGYRDHRTAGMDQEVYQLIPEEELYHRTGIQKQIFNTIYQLMAVKKQTPEQLQQAKTFLMLPDYFQFLLTGNKVSEYTNGTSTQLVNAESGQWDKELLDRLGYPEDIFLPLDMPGTEVGRLKEEICQEVGFDCGVVLCASHDTASAVMAMPAGKNGGVYISSGTWSLMGIENTEAKCDEAGRKLNFTNEGGYDRRFRYLKNIMGLWMIQSVRHELKNRDSFARLCEMARECYDFPSRVDVNDETFLAPESMIGAIREYCRKTGQQVPETTGEIASVIYHSLAECYGDTIKQIEDQTGRQYKEIYVIGGGSNAEYFNQLTADVTGKIVWAGPGEATAAGNIMAQMIQAGVLENLQDARNCVRKSFEIKQYIPRQR